MRRALGIAGLVLLALGAAVLIQTLRFGSKQVAVAPVTALTLDREALAARLAQALRFQTVSHQNLDDLNGAEFQALHRYLAEQFPRVHARLTKETVSEYTLLYTWPGSDPARRPIVLLSHIDVVPVEPGTEDQWSYPPFDGRIAEGYIWGRGALDDKLGVLATLEAVELLLRDGFQPRPTVYLAFGHDEEQGGDRGAKQVAALLHARGIEAEYVLDEGGAVIQGVMPGIAAPVAAIGIAEKGSVSLELTVHQQGGHSSTPPEHTAVGIVSTAVHRLERQQMPARLRGATQRFFEYAGPEMPFGYRLLFANLWLFRGVLERQLTESPTTNAMLRTTTAATMIEGGVKENVLPHTARAVVNFRILPGDSVQSVTEQARQVVNDARVQIQPLASAREPSAESPVDAASFAVLQRTIREVFPGAVAAPFLTIGGTDSRHYVAVSRNIYRFSPMVGDSSDLARLHGTNERISLENYERCVQFFAQLVKNSAGE